MMLKRFYKNQGIGGSRKKINNMAKRHESFGAGVEAKDKIRNFQPVITGEMIMEIFGIQPGKEVGIIKSAIREAILDGIIPNDLEHSWEFLINEGAKLGLKPNK